MALTVPTKSARLVGYYKVVLRPVEINKTLRAINR